MFSEYVENAMRHAHYEQIEDGAYFGDIPGFDGPYAGGNHEFMKKGALKLPIPNPHQGDISLPLLKRILNKALIMDDEWEQV